MAEVSSRKASDAVRKFNVDLLTKLPLEDKVFCGMVYQADLLPLGSADILKQYETRHEKVFFWLIL